ncbi:hypothetical protein ACFLEY_13990 [Bradyrhizobium sp. YCK136]|uniref:hypothetical protein n=1 Tax=Bradyrhizobium TaxID=374 RepID=UPI0035952019
MLKFNVILSEIAELRSAAACSIPARKLAGAAIAAVSKMRLMVSPPEVSATTEPGPPGPEALTAAWASYVSAGRTTGVGGAPDCPCCNSNWNADPLEKLSDGSEASSGSWRVDFKLIADFQNRLSSALALTDATKGSRNKLLEDRTLCAI